MSVSQCSGGDQQNSSSSFGDSSGNSFCWKVKDSNLPTVESQKAGESLSKLFQDMGPKEKRTSNGNSINSSDGKATCTKGASGGVLTQPNSGEYLGYCPVGKPDSIQSTSGLFIEKLKSSESNINLKLCSENCFKEKDPPSGGIKNGETKEGTGSDILFFKKN